MSQHKNAQPTVSPVAEPVQRGPVEIDAQLLKLVSGGIGEDPSPKGGWRGVPDSDAEEGGSSPKGGW